MEEKSVEFLAATVHISLTFRELLMAAFTTVYIGTMVYKLGEICCVTAYKEGGVRGLHAGKALTASLASVDARLDTESKAATPCDDVTCVCPCSVTLYDGVVWVSVVVVPPTRPGVESGVGGSA